MRVRRWVLATLSLGLITPAHSDDRITLRYGEIANSARGISTLGIDIAQRKGFFAREGIDFKVVGLSGTSFQVEALDKGDVDVVTPRCLT
jgi:ABC-type nitrate/sulfonate/bicarbonate transport system substrate-binding protein